MPARLLKKGAASDALVCERKSEGGGAILAIGLGFSWAIYCRASKALASKASLLWVGVHLHSMFLIYFFYVFKLLLQCRVRATSDGTHKNRCKLW
jgi:hypothetical protein